MTQNRTDPNDDDQNRKNAQRETDDQENVDRQARHDSRKPQDDNQQGPQSQGR